MTQEQKPLFESMIVAECESCGGLWRVETSDPEDVLEGVCMDCQNDSDTEKPLTFRRRWYRREALPDLPQDWLAP